jgi:apolipoprotein D and lipocalin family protein
VKWTPRLRAACVLPVLAAIAGCTSTPTVPTAGAVDLDRFMGDWYVIANIPTRFEVGAHNAVESYRVDDDGTIATTFTYRDGSFEGKEVTMRPRGYVRDGTNNAVWGMQFVWPIKAEYVISYVDPGYTRTIIARSKRDHVWIMARTPTLPPEQYAQLEQRVRELGYDVAQVQRVPQRWDAPQVAAAPGTASAPASAPVAKMSQQALLDHLEHHPEHLHVLDVRTPAEYAEGHVPGAVNVPHDQVADRLAEVPRDRDVVLYCRSGRRSQLAADVLRANGYERLSLLEGDMPGWIEQGHPVERP